MSYRVNAYRARRNGRTYSSVTYQAPRDDQDYIYGGQRYHSYDDAKAAIAKSAIMQAGELPDEELPTG
jgi:hypothetical protein